MSRWLPLIIFALLIVLLAGGIALNRERGSNSTIVDSPLIGKAAPAFELPFLHAPEVMASSADLAGQPYLFNVWGSWCPECRTEHAVITALAKNSGIRVVGYNYRDEFTEANRWLAQFGNPYERIFFDPEGRVAIDWGIYGAPETFLVDAQGVVRWKHVGPISQATMDTVLMPMIAELKR